MDQHHNSKTGSLQQQSQCLKPNTRLDSSGTSLQPPMERVRINRIGGSVNKRDVWMQVKTRKAIVTNASTFVAAASGMKNVSVSEMDQREIDRRNKSLNLQAVFQNAKPISHFQGAGQKYRCIHAHRGCYPG